MGKTGIRSNDPDIFGVVRYQMHYGEGQPFVQRFKPYRAIYEINIIIIIIITLEGRPTWISAR